MYHHAVGSASEAKHGCVQKASASRPRGESIYPRSPIDIEQLEELATIQCTQAEAAAVLKVSVDTLAKRLKEPEYAEAWERGRQNGRVSLRRRQWKKDTDTMLIWLGKQYLGQRDHPELEGDARSAALEYLKLQKGET